MLTQAELNAVREFAKAHGRRWKAELQKRWEHANCSPDLISAKQDRPERAGRNPASRPEPSADHPEHFEAATPIMPDVVAETCLGQRQHNLTPEQVSLVCQARRYLDPLVSRQQCRSGSGAWNRKATRGATSFMLGKPLA